MSNAAQRVQTLAQKAAICLRDGSVEERRRLRTVVEEIGVDWEAWSADPNPERLATALATLSNWEKVARVTGFGTNEACDLACIVLNTLNPPGTGASPGKFRKSIFSGRKKFKSPDANLKKLIDAYVREPSADNRAKILHSRRKARWPESVTRILDRMQMPEAAPAFLKILDFPAVGDARGISLLQLALSLDESYQPALRAYAENPAGEAEKLKKLFVDGFSRDPNLALRIWNTTGWPRPFVLVWREEMDEIDRRRGEHTPQTIVAGDKAERQQIVGLSFSGGGIRSATFGLGVLHAFAENGFLQQVDYLSTVSGGGYIGSWLSRWARSGQGGLQPVVDALRPPKSERPEDRSQAPVRFLRQYSNYLTPKLGWFSADTWTMAAIYVRNLLLNQAILIAGIAAILLIPRFLALTLLNKDCCAPTEWVYLPELLVGAALAFFAVLFMAINLNWATPNDDDRGATGATAAVDNRAFHRIQQQGWIQMISVLPLLVSCYLLADWFWRNIKRPEFQELNFNVFWFMVFAGFFVLSGTLTAWGGFHRRLKRRLSQRLQWLPVPAALAIPLLCGVVGTLLMRGYLAIIEAFYERVNEGGLWHQMIWGVPVLLAVFSLVAVVQVGLMGVDYPDSGREWLSRFRAWTNIYAFFWLAAFAVAVYGPLVFAWGLTYAPAWTKGISAGWILTTAGSLLAGKSSATGKTGEGAPRSSWLDPLAKVGPPIFLVGFVVFVSVAEHLLISHTRLADVGCGCNFAESLLCRHWQLLGNASLWPEQSPAWPMSSLLLLFSVLTGVTLLLAWRVDINEFSLHHFYRNRLVRGYLGASNSRRKPNPFTGFDQNDDIKLATLAPSAGHTGPYHILNTTLNLSAGDKLAWQQRKSASFVFTPRFSGFELERPGGICGPEEQAEHPGAPPGADLKDCAFRQTEHYAYPDGGIRLGTAMAISGAAASPNQGYHTSTSVAFLMTVFDVRLGWWIGNPRHDRSEKYSSPWFGLPYLVMELLGLTDDRASYVNLSDGGHFDNMGLYELVRRRCKYIVVCDAEQDARYHFGGLAQAIRMCRVDFGVEIDLDPQRIAPVADGAFSRTHCVAGTIHYPDAGDGIIVYLKTSITGDEPEDVVAYRANQPEFPQQSTADQWFSESQFESYRKLGYHAAKSAFQPAIDLAKNLGLNPDDKSVLFDKLKMTWHALNPLVDEHATKHTKTYTDLLDRLSSNAALGFLGAELFPKSGLKAAPPANDDAERQAFYFCLAVIQLLEDLYGDFNLYDGERVDDPEVKGWIDTYCGWTKAPTVDRTWQKVKHTYKPRFQAFWESLKRKDRSE